MLRRVNTRVSVTYKIPDCHYVEALRSNLPLSFIGIVSVCVCDKDREFFRKKNGSIEEFANLVCIYYMVYMDSNTDSMPGENGCSFDRVILVRQCQIRFATGRFRVLLFSDHRCPADPKEKPG